MQQIDNLNALERELGKTLFRQRLILCGAGLLATSVGLVSVWLLLTAIANIIILPVWLKLTLLGLAGTAIVTLLLKFVIRRLFEGSREAVAISLESKFPSLKGRLIAALQFHHNQKTEGFSADLIEATHLQALEQARLVRFDDVVSFSPVLRTGKFFSIAAVVATAFVILLPGAFSYSYKVFSNPSVEVAPPLGYSVTAVPGATQWIKYRDLTLGAVLVGQNFPEKVTISYRYAGGNWQSETRLVTDTRVDHLAHGDSANFGLTLRDVSKSLDYYVEAGRIKTVTYSIDVVDRPRVEGIKLSIFAPEYTRLEPVTLDENNGSFSAVVGSRATLRIAGNAPMATAELVFTDDSRIPLKVTGAYAEGAIVVDKTRTYTVRITDALGEENPDPIEYTITAIPDEYPSIEVLSPGYDANLSDDMALPIHIRFFDDFGFSSVVLKFVTVSGGNSSEEHVAVLNYSEKVRTEGEVQFAWNLETMDLNPGDYVSYFFEVADNDRISGPKITSSRRYIARVPSLDELIAETMKESDERIDETKEFLKSSKELSERLKQAARKLQSEERNSDKSWQNSKELQAITEKNDDLLKNIEKAAQDMNKAVDKMSQENLMSREALEKMQQIQKLFEEVATPEMKKAQSDLMEAMKNMDRKKLEEAMKNLQMTQKELMERLERTLALLKKMKAEQQMEAMVRQAEELARKQEELNKSTEQSSQDKLPQLSKKQDELKSSLENLQQQMASLEQAFKEAGLEKSKEAEKFGEAVKKTDAGQNMESASKQMQAQKKNESQSEGQQAHNKLMKMLGEMNESLASMKGENSEALKNAMRRAIDDVNYLSQSQEGLMNDAAHLDPRSAMQRELAARQQELKSACNGLASTISELGKLSPFVAAELSQLVNSAMTSMESASDGFSQMQGQNATGEQREAMSQLNKASVRMMESLDKQSQCDKGGSCSNPSQKLQSMCNSQKKLNQQTEGQCNNPGGTSSKPGSEKLGEQGLERLAVEQGSIRKSLEQLEQEIGNSRQILGRLDDIASEMKKVEEALASGEVGEETTDRQMKIYSRMLEAARSMQRKDFAEQRKATSAGEYDVFNPPTLSADDIADRSRLEERLNQFLLGKYPQQYQEQIKAYFRALLQVESAVPALQVR
jgi:hypothetical protein